MDRPGPPPLTPDPWAPTGPAVPAPQGTASGQDIPPQGAAQPGPPPGNPWATTGPAGPYGAPPPWGAPAPTNPWSIVALVTGLLCLVPVALATGAVALVQLRERPGRGRGLAIGGMVAAGCWAALFGLLVVIGLAGGFDEPDASPAVAAPATAPSVAPSADPLASEEPDLGTVADAPSTVVGDCTLPDRNGSGRTLVGCDFPHSEEVFLLGKLEDGPWAGGPWSYGEADHLCYDAFGKYVGADYADSDRGYTFYAPDKDEWATGERRVVCTILPLDSDTVSGSAKGRGKGGGTGT